MADVKEYLRFSVSQILEHWVMAISFTALAVTGLPQKFVGNSWAETMIRLMGGIEMVRGLHHWAATLMVLAALYHAIILAYKIFVLRVRWTMFPRLDDLFDALDAIRYNLGLAKDHPKFDRYNFAEKAEYWAMVWGTIIMGLTGFIMWNPINAARIMPGDMIPTSKAAHGAEAVLAVLAIIVWHFYNVHIKTLNKTVFTGKMTEHQMLEEHGLELERMKKSRGELRPSPEVLKKRERVFIPVATIAAVVGLILLFLFSTYENTAITTLPRRSQVQVFAPITPTPISRGTPAPTGQAISGKPLPASHVGRTTCLACHQTLAQPAMPADHAGRSDTTCTACHKPGGASVPTGSAQTGPTAVPASNAASGAAKAIPASHEGRTTCMSCHANLPQPALPADHKGREDSTCAACHKAASTAAAGATPAATAPAGGSTSAGGTPKPQPASHVGRTVCLACHQNLPQPAYPASHAGRQDATCAACHKAP